MKLVYALSVALMVSCNQKPKENTEPEVAEPEEKAVHLEPVVDHGETTLGFKEAVALIKTKQIPHIDTTNFDRFIDEDDISEINAKALGIEGVYPDFHDEGSNYRAMDLYRLELSPSFHTVVVTYRKGDHEMESTLINYDLEGNIIDHQLVAYDEIAEGMSRVESRISADKLTVNHIFWAEKKEIKQKEYSIHGDGIIEAMDSRTLSETLAEYTLVLSILDELQLHPLAVNMNLVTTKAMPQYPGGEIVVIPEIVDEGEHYFELNSHIVIANAHTGEITHRFFESAKTNQWVSDAIVLKEIKIDTAPYHVTEAKRAFGIRVYYYGMSHANPYENETLSLFVESGQSLQKILSNYSVMEYGGEWDTDCLGQFLRTEKLLIPSAEQTNGWFDFLVKSKITETINEEDESGECLSKETTSTETSRLKFNGEEYKNE
ncbi:hypothetical protein [Flagellimonas olearia]|uniref:Lipoprotein n=1 Tax=Flagellimonas olearia TaxID=552546 RepID=A0A444VQP6_9FLAO|nr:hypothetical protein [Allomuricauda olearia]RYC53138.1 hypothetical protein DN53_02665 [Allomuricauda olearia]